MGRGGQLLPSSPRSPVKGLGLVVNLADKTVTGFDVAVPIEHADAASISFEGKAPKICRQFNGDHFENGTISLSGELNRVTGVLIVTTSTKATWSKEADDDYYELVCKVTNRLF
jgi:hypothetical protein